MLSNRGFFGNAGRSRWMAGLALPSTDHATRDWVRTAVAGQMPKTAALPRGYGGESWALPQEAGAFASYMGFAMDFAEDIVLDAAFVYSVDMNFDMAAEPALEGLGVVVADLDFDMTADVALAALAPFDVTMDFDMELDGDYEAVAPFEVTMDFDLILEMSIEASAPMAVTMDFDMALEPDFSGGAVWTSDLSAFEVDGIINGNLYGLAVWSADEGAGASDELTPDSIALATVQALQATTIPVDVKKMNSAAVLGDGTSGNKWRGE